MANALIKSFELFTLVPKLTLIARQMSVIILLMLKYQIIKFPMRLPILMFHQVAPAGSRGAWFEHR